MLHTFAVIAVTHGAVGLVQSFAVFSDAFFDMTVGTLALEIRAVHHAVLAVRILILFGNDLRIDVEPFYRFGRVVGINRNGLGYLPSFFC